MRIGHIADIHISDHRGEEFRLMLAQLATSLRNKNLDLIVFAGDMFIHRDKLTPLQVELTRKFFMKDLFGQNFFIITGNHDISMSEKKIDSLSAVLSYGELKVITEIGKYEDIGDYRFHAFPYPTKSELTKLGFAQIGELTANGEEIYNKILNNFSQTKKNILVFHGTLEGYSFTDAYAGSEEAINVGKDLVLPKSFWSKFDAVFAGHLHKYQSPAYPGCPFPLTFADEYVTGWILWEDLKPSFVEVPQMFPYITIDAGSVILPTGATEELLTRIPLTLDYKNSRIRVKYKTFQNMSGVINHSQIAKSFQNAIDVKVAPSYLENNKDTILVPFDTFKKKSIEEIVSSYIDSNKYPPRVKDVSKDVEKIVKDKYQDYEGVGIHYRPYELTIKNFRSFGEDLPTIKFYELNTIVGIFGPNKTGKTSIIDAILWALHGKTPRSESIDDVVKTESEETTVEHVFFCYNKQYKVIRSRRLERTSSLNFYCNDPVHGWMDISGSTITTTQKNIDKLIGSFNIFISTMISPQEQIGLLFDKKPSERKQIILDCLQIDILNLRNEVASDLKKQTKDKLSRAKGKQDSLSEQFIKLDSLNSEGMLKEFESFITSEKVNQERINKYVAELHAQIESYTILDNDYKVINDKIEKLLEQIHTLENKVGKKKIQLEKLQTIASDKSIIDQKIAEIEDAENKIRYYTDLSQKITAKNNELKAAKAILDNIDKNYQDKITEFRGVRESFKNQFESSLEINCSEPKCPMNAQIREHNAKLKKNMLDMENKIQELLIQKEKEVTENTEKIKLLEAEIKEIPYDNKEFMKYMVACRSNEKSKWLTLKAKLDSGEDIFKDTVEIINLLTDQIKGIREERNELIRQRSDMAIKIKNLSDLKEAFKKAKDELKESNEKLDYYNKQVYTHTKYIKDRNDLATQIKEHENEIKDIEDYYMCVKKYCDIVGKSGVIYSFVDRAIPQLEGFAQKLLSEATDGVVSIYLDAHKTLVSGAKTDEVMVYFSDSKGRRSVANASGAERVLLSLALRASMTNLLSMRMGSQVELFVIDEGMGALDEENKIVVKNIFKKLAEHFKQILLITHISELKDVAQSIIQVKGGVNGSTFEIIKGVD